MSDKARVLFMGGKGTSVDDLLEVLYRVRQRLVASLLGLSVL